MTTKNAISPIMSTQQNMAGSLSLPPHRRHLTIPMERFAVHNQLTEPLPIGREGGG
jgi:hypothetical protein